MITIKLDDVVDKVSKSTTAMFKDGDIMEIIIPCLYHNDVYTIDKPDWLKEIKYTNEDGEDDTRHKKISYDGLYSIKNKSSMMVSITDDFYSFQDLLIPAGPKEDIASKLLADLSDTYLKSFDKIIMSGIGSDEAWSYVVWYRWHKLLQTD